MKRELLKFFFLLTLGVFASCSDSHVEERFFRLADGTSELVSFGAEASEQRISFETNQSYEVYSNASWLRATQVSDNTLSLVAQANPQTTKRTAELTIFSGQQRQKIRVEQAGLSTAVSVSEDAYTYGYWSGNYEITLNSLSEDWRVEVPENDWLQVTAEPHLKRILLSVSENRAYESRTLQLQLVHSGGTTPITITQQAGLSYILPFFEWGGNRASFDTKEMARRSVFVEGPAEATQVSAEKPFYVYETGSRLFPFIKYEMQDLQGNFMFRVILLPANAQVVRDAAFDTYLRGQGFEVQLNSPTTLTNYTKVYRNTTAKVTAVVAVKGEQAEVVFTPIVEQPQSYSTLDSISLGYRNFTDGTLALIQAHEAQIGGKYSETWSGVYKRQSGVPIEIFLSGAPFYARSYVFNTQGKLVQTIFFTDKLETGMYSYAKLYFMTRELQALLAREGYELNDIDNKGSIYTYIHREKRVALKFYYGKWNGQGVLAYNVIPIG